MIFQNYGLLENVKKEEAFVCNFTKHQEWLV